ncbi:hypothetical protein D3C73_1287170 [compost metagenome]
MTIAASVIIDNWQKALPELQPIHWLKERDASFSPPAFEQLTRPAAVPEKPVIDPSRSSRTGTSEVFRFTLLIVLSLFWPPGLQVIVQTFAAAGKMQGLQNSGA